MANTLYPAQNKQFQVNTASGGSLTTGLLAYWKLEDLNDFWSTNQLTNNNSVTFTAAKIANGANSGTSNSSKSLNVATSLGIQNGAFSVSFWFKWLTLPSGFQTLFHLGNSTTSVYNDVSWGYTGGNLGVSHGRNNIDNTVVNLTTLSDTTTFHHVVMTYDGDGATKTVTGWYDGVSIGTSTASGGNGNSLNNDCVLSAFDLGSGIGGWSSSVIDEVGVWSKALNSNEVSDLYNAGAGQTMIGQITETETEAESVSIAVSAGFHISVYDTETETEFTSVVIPLAPGVQPVITFRTATFPYGLLPSPFIYSETIANQSGLPILAGDNSDSMKFRIYNNFGLQANTSTAYNLTVTTYDSSSHSSTIPLVTQEWVSLQENGYGLNSTVANVFTLYQDTATFVGGVNNQKTFAVGADGGMSSNIPAGLGRVGCGFIEVNTFAWVPLGQSTQVYSAVLTATFDWST